MGHSFLFLLVGCLLGAIYTLVTGLRATVSEGANIGATTAGEINWTVADSGNTFPAPIYKSQSAVLIVSCQMLPQSFVS